MSLRRELKDALLLGQLENAKFVVDESRSYPLILRGSHETTQSITYVRTDRGIARSDLTDVIMPVYKVKAIVVVGNSFHSPQLSHQS